MTISYIYRKEVNFLKTRAKAVAAAKAAMAKKAEATIILELKGITTIADYFVICSGENTTQVRAIADNVRTELKEGGIIPLSVEGLKHAHWILIDYGDIIVHIFLDETRAYYELEKLWLDAPLIKIED